MRRLFPLFVSLALLGCFGFPSSEALKQSMQPVTRRIATNADEAFACLRLNVFDGRWVNSVDQRTFVIGSGKVGNINAIAELSPVDAQTSQIAFWHVGGLTVLSHRLDSLILTRCQGVRLPTD